MFRNKTRKYKTMANGNKTDDFVNRTEFTKIGFGMKDGYKIREQ